MKRKTITARIFAICIAISCLTGCTQLMPPHKNEVAPTTLTEDQQEIVDLLTDNNNELLLFDFKTQDAYKSVEFWAETYENGVLIDKPSGVNTSNDEAKPLDGRAAVVISRDSGVRWSFTLTYNGAKYSHESEAVEIDETLARAFGPVSSPVAIESGKEIVLYTALYSHGDIRTPGDEQEYVTRPELLAEYPLAHLIKCRFTLAS